MCLAIPGKIISIKKDAAITDFGGVKKEVNISLVKAQKNDYVIVHAGFAIQKISSEDAQEVFKIYEESKKIHCGHHSKDK
jgi:hydrogenase expression/formation protein HypC